MERDPFADVMAYIGGAMMDAEAGPANELDLSLTKRGGGSAAGDSSGEWGIRLDSREDAPHCWLVVRKRTPLSLEPYVVDVVRVDDEERPKSSRSKHVLASHTLPPRAEPHVLSIPFEGEELACYAQVLKAHLDREVLGRWVAMAQLTFRPRSPVLRELVATWDTGNFGMRMELDRGANVWAWLMDRERGKPYDVRLLVVEGGVPTKETAGAATILARVEVPLIERAGGATRTIEADHAGVHYALEIDFTESARRSLALLQGSM